MAYLFDGNLLIALIDPAHTAHEMAHSWFSAVGSSSWATCPLTQNGVVRVVGHARYPSRAASPSLVATLVRELLAHPGHEFWPDDISLVGSEHIDIALLKTSAQITDTYLLALARAHGGKLATLDRRLSVTAVRDGREALCLIEA